MFGIPETASGRGKDEFKVVRDYLALWGVKEQVVGMVLDTTASNSGEPAHIWRSSYNTLSYGWPAGGTWRSCTLGKL